MTPEQNIEAILFYRGEPVKRDELGKILKLEESALDEALAKLEVDLSDRGIRLMRVNETVLLGTAPEASELIEQLAKEELSKDIGKAGIETLSTVLYLGPITRSRVDYVRGVNSSFILRNLLVRGLVERITNPDDSRTFLYRPTRDLLAHLGVTRVEELPEYEKTRQALVDFENRATTGNEAVPITSEKENTI